MIFSTGQWTVLYTWTEKPAPYLGGARPFDDTDSLWTCSTLVTLVIPCTAPVGTRPRTVLSVHLQMLVTPSFATSIRRSMHHVVPLQRKYADAMPHPWCREALVKVPLDSTKRRHP
jgi:hypothetical protein